MPKNPIIVTGKHRIHLGDHDPRSTAGLKNKKTAKKERKELAREIGLLQETLFSQKTYAVLVIFHGTDTSGKSSTMGYVFCDVHTAGFEVTSFKAPSSEELDHDYLWRCVKNLPRRGHIGAFDRSYYEELSVVRVHPELLLKQRIPSDVCARNIWKARFKEIRNFERYLTQNGIVVIKFYLNVSKDEQGKRLRKRLFKRKKNCKFSAGDIGERKYWDNYQRANEDMINHTSTPSSPWYILPADRKWVTRALAAKIVARRVRALHSHYPVMSRKERVKNLGLLQKVLREEKKK